jgi:hypothetical protein
MKQTIIVLVAIILFSIATGCSAAPVAQVPAGNTGDSIPVALLEIGANGSDPNGINSEEIPMPRDSSHVGLGSGWPKHKVMVHAEEIGTLETLYDWGTEYYPIRQIAIWQDFFIDWDEETKTITIDTTQPYATPDEELVPNLNGSGQVGSYKLTVKLIREGYHDSEETMKYHRRNGFHWLPGDFLEKVIFFNDDGEHLWLPGVKDGTMFTTLSKDDLRDIEEARRTNY